jgi:iduronate 2-sulfatase
VGFLKPHLPFVSPKKYWDLYDRGAFPLPELKEAPEGAPSFAKTTWGELRNYSDIPQRGPLSDEQTRELIHGYYAALSYTDAQIGRVIAALDETGLAKNTIVVLWGDHGWHLGDHGQWCKHTNYEQAARIPLIVAAPGVSPERTGSLVESVDVYPTLCELAGLPAPQDGDGTSFAATLSGTAKRTKESIIHVYPRNQMIGRAIRTARHRLVEWKKPGDPADTAVYELYDYEADPAETKNLASAQPEVVARLKEILARYAEAKPQVKAPAASTGKKPTDRNQLFASKDKDNDGKLTKDEFLANQPDPDKAPARFTKFDADGDGLLTKDEFVNMGKK